MNTPAVFPPAGSADALADKLTITNAADQVFNPADVEPTEQPGSLVKTLTQGATVTAERCGHLLEQLQTMRHTWEATELAASHSKLYSLLTECYSYYLTMKSSSTSKETREAMARGLKEFANAHGFGTQSEPHGMNLVVKVVFGSAGRRRVSAYALALRAALTAHKDVHDNPTPVPVTELAHWIRQQGGIEEVRMSQTQKGSAPSAAERIAMATNAVKNTLLLTIKPDPRKLPFGTDDADSVVILVATYCPTGELAINAVVRNSSAVNAAMEAYYAANKQKLGNAIPNQAGAKPSALANAIASTN